jgi:hypothetical protein
MNKKTLQDRTKFYPAYKKKILEAKPSTISRRDSNYVDLSDLKTDNVISDFFEFEKELSELKASNKLNSNDEESR